MSEDRLEPTGISASVLQLMTRKRPSESKSCRSVCALHMSYEFLSANSRQEPYTEGVLGNLVPKLKQPGADAGTKASLFGTERSVRGGKALWQRSQKTVHG